MGLRTNLIPRKYTPIWGFKGFCCRSVCHPGVRHCQWGGTPSVLSHGLCTLVAPWPWWREHCGAALISVQMWTCTKGDQNVKCCAPPFLVFCELLWLKVTETLCSVSIFTGYYIRGRCCVMSRPCSSPFNPQSIHRPVGWDNHGMKSLDTFLGEQGTKCHSQIQTPSSQLNRTLFHL